VLVASKGVRRSKLVKCFIVLHCMRWRLGGRSWRENIADAWGGVRHQGIRDAERMVVVVCVVRWVMRGA
jgi:hypothetical protein